MALLGAVEKSRASDVTQPYNLQLGPVNIRADAGLSTSFNDNVGLTKTGRLADFILDPTAAIHGQWQATELNLLTFDLGLGYDLYTVHSQYSYITITPDSQISFNVFIGDFKINFHDNFSYQQDPLLEGQLSNQTRFPFLTNDAGIEVTWNLNAEIALSAGYDHITYRVFDQTYTYLDYDEDELTPQFSLKLSPTITTGLNTSFSESDYYKNTQSSNTSISGGPFLNAQMTNVLSVNAQGGYISTTYNNSGQNRGNQDINSFYASVGVTHKINEDLTQTLTAGRDFLPGLASNYTQRLYANYSISWQTTQALRLGMNLSFENLGDSNGNTSPYNVTQQNPNLVPQTSNRFQAGLKLDYSLSLHASLTLSYQYTVKDSNVSDLSFYQNQITAGCKYQF